MVTVKRHPFGTTLVELMVAMTVFLTMMSAIMTFYIQGSKVTTHQESRMEALRRSLRVLDRLETQLAYSRLIFAESGSGDGQESLIIFVKIADPDNGKDSYTSKGTSWENVAHTIRLITSDDGGKRTLVQTTATQQVVDLASLYPDESLTFSANSHALNVKLKMRAHPEAQSSSPTSSNNDEDDSRYIKLERAIPIYNSEEF